MTTRAAVDDLYRIFQDESDVSEAMWQTAKEYGVQDRIAVDEQAAIAHKLHAVLRSRSGPLMQRDIKDAFERIGLRIPARGYARDVIARLERLDRGRD